jgi:hypothetical protein
MWPRCGARRSDAPGQRAARRRASGPQRRGRRAPGAHRADLGRKSSRSAERPTPRISAPIAAGSGWTGSGAPCASRTALVD